MIAAFILWTLVAVGFVTLGVYSRHAQKPAGFWANVEAPRVTDIRAYNRALSNLWLAAAVGHELLGQPLLVYQQNSPTILLMVLG